jgi:hypothetical protein
VDEREQRLNVGQPAVDRRSSNDRRSGIDTQLISKSRPSEERRSGRLDRRSGKERRSTPRFEFQVD